MHDKKSLPTPSAQGAVARACLLGPFELEIEGRSIVEWRGQRGLSVLKFILAQPKRRCPRDVLLREFWPDVDPERARNRLHVALSATRRAVRSVIDVDLIEYWDGSYRISPTIELTLDVDRFSEFIDRGREAEFEGRHDEAAQLFEAAVELYRGDFLADDPYESWTLVPRESQRIEYLDLLDRLAQLHIDAGRIYESADVAQRILVQDDCREDAHRLLMRCCAVQGRVTQLDRQYELCRRTLSGRLGAKPSPLTFALYRELRLQAAATTQIDWHFDEPAERHDRPTGSTTDSRSSLEHLGNRDDLDVQRQSMDTGWYLDLTKIQ